MRGETIPHEEKVLSIFEEHTRQVSKGKAGTPVELGVPVALIEDQYQFILHHRILWEGEDVDVAVPMVQEAQARHPKLRACSFDRGFYNPDNRVRLDALLDVTGRGGVLRGCASCATSRRCGQPARRRRRSCAAGVRPGTTMAVDFGESWADVAAVPAPTGE